MEVNSSKKRKRKICKTLTLSEENLEKPSSISELFQSNVNTDDVAKGVISVWIYTTVNKQLNSGFSKTSFILFFAVYIMKKEKRKSDTCLLF